MAGTSDWHTLTGGGRLWEVSASGGSTVLLNCNPIQSQSRIHEATGAL